MDNHRKPKERLWTIIDKQKRHHGTSYTKQKKDQKDNNKIRDLICFNALTNWKGLAEAYHPKKREKLNNNLKIRRRRKK